MNRIDIARIEFDMWKRRQIENVRSRILRAVPASWLYHFTIQATVRTLRNDEHPDAIGAMEVVRRLAKGRAA
jgi:hypothetical protein